MIVTRYIDLRLDDDEDVVIWSEESWANALHLLLHRLHLEIVDAFPLNDYAQVLWPGLTIQTFEAVDANEHDVLRVQATVEVRERDAP